MCSGAILNAGVMRVVYGVTEAQFQKFIKDTDDKKPLTCRETMARTYPAVKGARPADGKSGRRLVQHRRLLAPRR